MLTSMMFAPAFDLLPGDRDRLFELSLAHQPGELPRAGDVGPLADHREGALRAAAPAAPGRCSARRAAARAAGAAARRPRPSAIARMCSGVVPQQPPTMFSQPLAANSPSTSGHLLGRFVVAAEFVGQARRWDGSWSARRQSADSSSTYGRISSGPSAQLMPTLNRSAWRDRDRRRPRASGPESVRPLRSVIVTETITGSRTPRSLEILFDGEQAGLEVERVEDGFGQEQIDARLDQRRDLLVVGRDQLVEGDGPIAGIVHVRRERGRAIGRSDRAGDEPRPRRRPASCFDRLPRAADRGEVDRRARDRPDRSRPARCGWR